MSDKQYISVSEFAKKANVSRQTIYNRLDTDLTCFVKMDLHTGRKSINVKGLILFNNGQESVKGDVNLTVKDDIYLDTLEPRENDENMALLIETLQRQLEERNKDIEELKSEKQELKDELKQANEHNRTLSSNLVELNKNQQILLKQSQDKVLELEEPKEETLLKRLFKKK